MREEREALGDVANAASLDPNVANELVAVPDGSRARAVKTREAAQQRGLTRARGTEHREMIDARLVSDAQVERAESMVEVEAHRLSGDRRGRRWTRHDRRTRRRESHAHAAHQHDHDGHGEGEGRWGQGRGQSAPAELVVGVDRQRRGVVGENDDGAVLAEGS